MTRFGDGVLPHIQEASVHNTTESGELPMFLIPNVPYFTYAGQS